MTLSAQSAECATPVFSDYAGAIEQDSFNAWRVEHFLETLIGLNRWQSAEDIEYSAKTGVRVPGIMKLFLEFFEILLLLGTV